MNSFSAYPVMQMNDIRFCYGENLLFDKINIVIKRGEFVSLTGPNGSGKSTLIRLFAGLLKPLSGHVLLEGVDLARYSYRNRARKIAYVPQHTYFQHPYSVFDIVLMGRFPHNSSTRFDTKEDIEICERMLCETGIIQFKHRSFDTLSGGERQRVIIAAALAQQPDLLLLDEPLASLDMRYQFQIMNMLLKLNEQRPISIIIGLHDLNLAAWYTKRTILLGSAAIPLDGRSEDLLIPSILEPIFGISLSKIRDERSGRSILLPCETEIGF